MGRPDRCLSSREIFRVGSHASISTTPPSSTPVPTRNASAYPSVSASGEAIAPPSGPPRCVDMTARPSEPPIVREVLTSPDTRPASPGAAPDVASAASGVAARPAPSIIRIPGHHDRGQVGAVRASSSTASRSRPTADRACRAPPHCAPRAGHEARGEFRADDDRQRGRDQGESGVQRGVAEHVLGVQRHEEPHARTSRSRSGTSPRSPTHTARTLSSPSGISGAAVRDSTRRKSPTSASPAASGTQGGRRRPPRGLGLRDAVRQGRESRRRPAARPAGRAVARPRRGSRAATAREPSRTTAPTGTLISSTQRQDRPSTSAPADESARRAAARAHGRPGGDGPGPGGALRDGRVRIVYFYHTNTE